MDAYNSCSSLILPDADADADIPSEREVPSVAGSRRRRFVVCIARSRPWRAPIEALSPSRCTTWLTEEVRAVSPAEASNPMRSTEYELEEEKAVNDHVSIIWHIFLNIFLRSSMSVCLCLIFIFRPYRSCPNGQIWPLPTRTWLR